uniref:Uncharacterized protein orf150 n=1 Tax=Chlorokybus atmophyticus TaxID=3144 RepID=A6YE96_CHLAT|nr:hypothetical protein Chatpmp24 [Chlorokybus atmophyticus]ABO15146.1 hypothetical protein [Chlorokybus atmophyticus]
MQPFLEACSRPVCSSPRSLSIHILIKGTLCWNWNTPASHPFTPLLVGNRFRLFRYILRLFSITDQVLITHLPTALKSINVQPINRQTAACKRCFYRHSLIVSNKQNSCLNKLLFIEQNSLQRLQTDQLPMKPENINLLAHCMPRYSSAIN